MKITDTYGRTLTVATSGGWVASAFWSNLDGCPPETLWFATREEAEEHLLSLRDINHVDSDRHLPVKRGESCTTVYLTVYGCVLSFGSVRASILTPVQ